MRKKKREDICEVLCVQDPPPPLSLSLLVYRNENLQCSTWIKESGIAIKKAATLKSFYWNAARLFVVCRQMKREVKKKERKEKTYPGKKNGED